VDVFLDPSTYLALATQPMLRGLLDRLVVVVHASATGLATAHGAAVTSARGYRAA
jgi:carbonic anhydrase